MKYLIIIFLSLYSLNNLLACDCGPTSIEDAYKESTEVVLGKILKAELKTYIINKESKDSIQNHYHILVFNDTISFVEYTVQIIKNYKNTQESSELIIRAEADKSDCDIRLLVGVTYILYGHTNWWTNLYYPNDKYFVLSSECSRTTLNWKREQQELEEYLLEKE